jgi:hypothetical protein
VAAVAMKTKGHGLTLYEEIVRLNERIVELTLEVGEERGRATRAEVREEKLRGELRSVRDELRGCGLRAAEWGSRAERLEVINAELRGRLKNNG